MMVRGVAILIGGILVLGWIGETGAQSLASYEIARCAMSGRGTTSTSASDSIIKGVEPP